MTHYKNLDDSAKQACEKYIEKEKPIDQESAGNGFIEGFKQGAKYIEERQDILYEDK